MAGWSGFTDEELTRLKYEKANANRKVNVQRETNLKQKAAHFENRRPNNKAKSMSKQISEMHSQKEQHHRSNNLNQESTKKPSKPEKVNGNSNESHENQEVNDPGGDNSSHVITDSEVVKQITDEKQVTAASSAVREKDAMEIKLLSDNDAVELEMTKLEKLQKVQKEIEEENKLKQKIIKDAITERYKKAQMEASTLHNIQKDLAALDNLLATDVEILRRRIEDASFAFSHAKKRYEKAEKEFVDSKLELQLKSDKKEQLTQHLYTIIQENELRKAKKLEELMGKLNMPESTKETTKTVEENKEIAEQKMTEDKKLEVEKTETERKNESATGKNN